MDSFTLRYGRSRLALSKSEEFVGVRPSAGAAGQVAATLSPAAGTGLAEDFAARAR